MLTGVTGGSDERAAVLFSACPDYGLCLKSGLASPCLAEMKDLRSHAHSCLFLFGLGVLTEALHRALPEML